MSEMTDEQLIKLRDDKMVLTNAKLFRIITELIALRAELEKARGENDTLVAGMTELAERAAAAVNKAVAERDYARALLRERQRASAPASTRN